MKPYFKVDGSSGDAKLERHIADQFMRIWEGLDSPQFRKDFKELLEERFELFKKKQKSYGSNNIAALGMKGIFVRIWDKVQRLRNLIWLEQDNPLEDESIEDTFGDLAVYAAMAVVLMNSKWPKYQDDDLTFELFEKELDVLRQQKHTYRGPLPYIKWV